MGYEFIYPGNNMFSFLGKYVFIELRYFITSILVLCLFLPSVVYTISEPVKSQEKIITLADLGTISQTKKTTKNTFKSYGPQQTTVTTTLVGPNTVLRDIKDTQVIGQQNNYYVTNKNVSARDNQNVSSEKQVKTAMFNLPPRNNKFTRRREFLIQIRKQLDINKIGITTQVISGLGGVGKTQLAIEFAYQSAERNDYGVVLWISAETHNSINNTYLEFAKSMQIDIRRLKPNEVQNLVHRKLSQMCKNTGILFILDNVSKYDDIQNYIGELNKHLIINFPLHILITSHSQHWPESPLILDSFTPQEALVFIKKHLPDEDENSIYKLAKNLHYFPLALGQAVAYIKQHTNINDYLKLYITKKIEYLDKFSGDRNQYKKSLWATWTITLTKLSDVAKEILYISCYLYPDDIPIVFFDNFDLEQRGNAIEELRNHSFIILTNNKSFRIHRLLQEVIRTTIYSGNKIISIRKTRNHINKRKYQILNKALDLLKNKFEFSYTRFENWDVCGQYLMHAQSLAEYCLLNNDEYLYVGLQLYAQIAMYLSYARRDHEHTKIIWEKLMMLMKKHYAEDDSLTLVLANIYTHLGFIMRNMGDIIRAIQYVEKATLIYDHRIPNISIGIDKLLINLRWNKNLMSYEGVKCDQSAALITLGMLKQDLADFKAAKDSYEKAFGILNKCKQEHFIAIYKSALFQAFGDMYRHCGDIKKSIDILNSAKNISDNNFPDQLEQADTYEYMASLLYYMGMYSAAKEYLVKCLKIRLFILPRGHPSVGVAKSLLGLILCSSGHNNECIYNLKEAERIYDESYVKGHVKFILLYLYMSYAYEMHKEYDAALQYFIAAKKIAIKIYGEKTSTILAHEFAPVEKFPFLGSDEKNTNYYAQTLDIVRQLFGKNHIRVARYCFLLGQVFENIYAKDKAKKYYQEALNIAAKQHFDSDVLTTAHQTNIKIVKGCLGRL